MTRVTSLSNKITFSMFSENVDTHSSNFAINFIMMNRLNVIASSYQVRLLQAGTSMIYKICSKCLQASLLSTVKNCIRRVLNEDYCLSAWEAVSSIMVVFLNVIDEIAAVRREIVCDASRGIFSEQSSELPSTLLSVYASKFCRSLEVRNTTCYSVGL